MLHVLLICLDAVLTAALVLHSSTSASICTVDGINSHVNRALSADDVKMEAFPFKIGDYNRDVQLNYPGEKGLGMTLQYPDDVIAFVVIYNDNDHNWSEAPQVLDNEYQEIEQFYSGTCFTNGSMRFIRANTMHTTADGLTLPIVHVQTAGHTAGGAFYYQRHHVVDEPDHWANKTIYGMSAHQDFGLDTRFSGVFVFEELHDAMFISRVPTDVAKTEEDKIKILDEYNTFG